MFIYETIKYHFLYWVWPEHCVVYITNFIRWHINSDINFNNVYGIFMPIGFLKQWCKLILWYKIRFFNKNSLERILPNGKQNCIIVSHKGMVLFKFWRSTINDTIIFDHSRFYS